MRDTLENRSGWPLALVLSFFVCLGFWKWIWNVDVLDYGPTNKTYFSVAKAGAGQAIRVCFAGVTWLRTCPSRMEQRVSCQQIDPLDTNKTVPARLDLDAHTINAPEKSGPVEPKCRRFVVPFECQPGPLTFSMTAKSWCAPFGSLNTRYAYPPELKLEVVP